MSQKAHILLKKLITGESLSVVELKEIKELFSGKNYKKEIEQWIENNWELADSADVEISYDRLKHRVVEYENRKSLSKPFYQKVLNVPKYYQRIAAILFIPLFLSVSIYLFYSPDSIENFYTAEAPLGQKAKVSLPDGTTVWLNSGSSIRYSSNFNNKNRTIKLSGEALFDVKKNIGKPFYVLTPFLDVKVTGTVFNINAYEDEPSIETSLVEGKIEVLLKNEKKSIHLMPGNLLAYSKSSHKVTTQQFNEEAVIGWKDNRLIFINDDFYKLTRKIEKWYNIDIVCDLDDFKGNRLTVRLLEGESLSKLLEIIESAVGANCVFKESEIYITKK